MHSPAAPRGIGTRRRCAWWLRVVVAVVAAAATVGGAGPVLRAADRGPQAALLAATLAPSQLPADGQTTPALYLELLDANARPARRGTPTVVTLASTDGSVATVPDTFTIPAGVSTVQVPVATTGRAGTTTLQARAPGLVSGGAALRTVAAAGPAPGAKLALSVAPAAFFRGGTGPAWATVVLEDGKGTPFLARQPVVVDLVSSDPGVIGLPPSVTIASGAYMATVPVQAGALGGVTLAALAPGFVAGTVQSRVVAPGRAPVSLELTAVPPVLVPGTVAHLVGEAVDETGSPVPFPCGALHLASTDTSVLDVARSATPPCAASQESVSVDAAPAAGAGPATIAAAQNGLVPGSVHVSVMGSAPARLEATVAPPVLMYGSPVEGWLVIQAVDAGESPVDVARPVATTLSGGDGALPGTATIPAGAAFAAVPISGLDPGATSTVSIAAPGFQPLQVALAPTVPALGAGSGSHDPAPTIALWGIRLPVVWVALVLAVAASVLGILMARSSRTPPGGIGPGSGA